MSTIKSYTDLQQSKVLAKILPLESADMIYTMVNGYHTPFIRIETIKEMHEDDVLCWSLAALLDVLPKIINNETLFIETSAALWHIGYRNIYTARADNPVDACYEMILKLNELNLL